MGKTAGELAAFFSSISQEFPPLRRELLQRTYDRQVNEVTVEEVAERIRTVKKPASSVQIDPLKRFLSTHSMKLAEGITPIINSVRKGGCWPAIWKEEEGTIIPKCNHPESLDQTRNINCTSIFSKVCESYLVDWVLEVVDVDPQQFGARNRHWNRPYVNGTHNGST